MLLTKKKLENTLKLFLQEIEANNILVEKMILFGSYVKGCPNNNSDVDIAVWSKDFEGNRLIDTPKIAHVLSKFPIIELHPFNTFDTENTNPFITEILKSGIVYKATN